MASMCHRALRYSHTHNERTYSIHCCHCWRLWEELEKKKRQTTNSTHETMENIFPFVFVLAILCVTLEWLNGHTQAPIMNDIVSGNWDLCHEQSKSKSNGKRIVLQFWLYFCFNDNAMMMNVRHHRRTEKCRSVRATEMPHTLQIHISSHKHRVWVWVYVFKFWFRLLSAFVLFSFSLSVCLVLLRRALSLSRFTFSVIFFLC